MLKIITLNGITDTLVSLTKNEEITVIECSNSALLVENLTETLFEAVYEALSGEEDILHICSNTKETYQGLEGLLVKRLILTDYTVDNKDIIHSVANRYTGEQHIITDDGVYEVNSIDLSPENKFFRINISGEYNDLLITPKRGTSYASVFNELNKLLDTPLLDFRTENNTLEINKVRMEVKNI